MKPVITWILVADAARARIVSNSGPGKGVEAIDGMDIRSEIPMGRDIDADRPGRTQDSAGPGRHAMEAPTDPREQARHAFVGQLASLLADRVDAYDRLIVVAPPKTLGDLRAELSGPVQGKVTGELAKDLTKVPNDALAQHLEDTIVL